MINHNNYSHNYMSTPNFTLYFDVPTNFDLLANDVTINICLYRQDESTKEYNLIDSKSMLVEKIKQQDDIVKKVKTIFGLSDDCDLEDITA